MRAHRWQAAAPGGAKQPVWRWVGANPCHHPKQPAEARIGDALVQVGLGPGAVGLGEAVAAVARDRNGFGDPAPPLLTRRPDDRPCPDHAGCRADQIESIRAKAVDRDPPQQ